MTTLSPRLAHLLIHEDRSTGRLIMPDGSGAGVHEPRLPTASGPIDPNISRANRPVLSPPLSPMTQAFEPSPNDTTVILPAMLPPPGERRPSTSIFSLLNDVRPTSPSSASSPRPSTSSALSLRKVSSSTNASSRSGGSSPPPHAFSYPHPQTHLRIQPPPHTYNYAAPRTAPSHPASYDNRTHYLERQRQPSLNFPSAGAGLEAPRPDLFRRHSGQPYEQAHTARAAPYPSPAITATAGPSTHQPHRPMEDFSSMIGSRAPISRTTKACNACRSRKVRCDAGGLPNGEPGTCSRCREAGASCVYSGPQKKRGPCPGTVRQAHGAKASTRRSSHRSSVTSIATSHIATPPSEDEHPQWSSRSSYDFQAPTHSSHPKQMSSPAYRPHTSSNASVPVLSWPAMSPAIEADAEPRGVFRENYTMRPKTGGAAPGNAGPVGFGTSGMPSPLGLSLPPLRVAIEERQSYYTP